MMGAYVGCVEGEREDTGFFVGVIGRLGVDDGASDGANDGILVGRVVGSVVGATNCDIEGTVLGSIIGKFTRGNLVGKLVGVVVIGCWVRYSEGLAEGIIVGGGKGE